MGDHKLILEAEKDFDGDDFDAAIKAAILKRNKKHKSSASADAKEEPIERSPKAPASESGHGKDEGDSSPPAKSTLGPAGGDDSEYAHELFTVDRGEDGTVDPLSAEDIYDDIANESALKDKIDALEIQIPAPVGEKQGAFSHKAARCAWYSAQLLMRAGPINLLLVMLPAVASSFVPMSYSKHATPLVPVPVDVYDPPYPAYDGQYGAVGSASHDFSLLFPDVTNETELESLVSYKSKQKEVPIRWTQQAHKAPSKAYYTYHCAECGMKTKSLAAAWRASYHYFHGPPSTYEQARPEWTLPKEYKYVDSSDGVSTPTKLPLHIPSPNFALSPGMANSPEPLLNLSTSYKSRYDIIADPNAPSELVDAATTSLSYEALSGVFEPVRKVEEFAPPTQARLGN